jgi:hypothetical protein
MLPIPPALQGQFEEYLKKKSIPVRLHGLHKKWLRYYLDFCRRYDLPPAQGESLPRYIQKLREKNQTTMQQEQAARAVTLYYEILKTKSPFDSEPLIQDAERQEYAFSHYLEGSSVRERGGKPVLYEKAIPSVARFSASSATERGFSQTGVMPCKNLAQRQIGIPWKAEYTRLGDEIKVRHATWQFRNFGKEGLVVVAPVNDDFVFVH